jgi:excisionase family DNA binding protein
VVDNGINKEVLSTKEFAQKVGVSVRTVRDWVKRGKVESTVIKGRKGKSEYRFTEEEVKKIRGRNEGSFTSLEVKGEVQPKETPFTSSPVQDPLQQAVFRIGWLEGQLELYKRMLTEGSETVRAREEEMISTRRKAEEKAEEAARLVTEKAEIENKLIRARDETEGVRLEKEALAVRIRELERPWWKRWFGAK